MSESGYQPQGDYGGAPQTESAQRLEAAAADFRRNIQEASDKLGNAGAQLVAVSQELATAIAEAKQAAEQAREAQRKTEETQQQMQRDYGVVSDLVRDLQERIGALATLARPMSFEDRRDILAQANPEAQDALGQTNESGEPAARELRRKSADSGTRRRATEPGNGELTVWPILVTQKLVKRRSAGTSRNEPGSE